MLLKELFESQGDSHSKLEQLGDWILAQYTDYDLNQEYDGFVDGFYKAMDRADDEYHQEMLKLYNQVKSSRKNHTVEDDLEYHDVFDAGDKIPRIERKVLSHIHSLIQDAAARHDERLEQERQKNNES